MQPWTTRNLAGRGVLIDYAAYAKRQGISYEAFSNHPITIADVEVIAKEQGVIFNTGDVLFLRTGYVAAYKAADETRRNLAAEGKWTGLSQGRETVEWLWSKQFAALAADCPGFEMIREFLPAVVGHSSCSLRMMEQHLRTTTGSSTPLCFRDGGRLLGSSLTWKGSQLCVRRTRDGPFSSHRLR